MNIDLQQIRDSQKESWDKFSPGWEKWDDFTMEFLRAHAEAIIHYAKPGGSDMVLDIAAGTGEPGLTIAPMLIEGTVIVTDLSEGMLQVAREKAEARGILNLETMTADACELPFDDNTFDVVSCRLGLMFFPDMHLAAKEIVRVLKPSGRIATTVWGSPTKNFWATCMAQNISEYIEMPTPPEGAPGIFRCSEIGFIAEVFKQAGLRNIIEEEIPGTLNCDGAEEYWDFMTEVAAPVVAALSNADEETIEKIRAAVINSVNENYPNQTHLDASGILIYGEK